MRIHYVLLLINKCVTIQKTDTQLALKLTNHGSFIRIYKPGTVINLILIQGITK